jgi:Outer membrane lipoprotein-sorting protein
MRGCDLSAGPWVRIRSCLAALSVLAAVLPQSRATDAAPSQAEAAQLLAQFRQAIWQEPTYAEFDLREMPRRGDERLYHGRFWGGRTAEGPVTRIEFFGAAGSTTRRVLVQGGPETGIWMTDGAGPGKPSPGALLEPVIPGLEITPFDLLPMPYLYWLDASLTGVERIRGRVANVYLMTAPGDFPAGATGIRAVRAYLDAQYNALEQSEVLRGDGSVVKTMSLLELRKVGNHWVPKDMDVRTEATRDKTRITLTAIAVGIALPAGVFEPETLGTPLAAPSGDAVIRITQ